ncbi:MAG: arginine--tRNA ligase [Chitinophagales bacterium]|nr:arginine--tRNA ligase [Chitinophagales bacterium]
MENLKEQLVKSITDIFKRTFNTDISSHELTFNETPKNFVGDLTLVVFPLLKYTRLNPEASAQTIGKELAQLEFVKDFNVVKGFLNLVISDDYWKDYFIAAYQNPNFGKGKTKKTKILIEYSSPNTNKPLHLGHIRNNVLGYAVAGVLKAAGYQVNTCNLVNDRGIHICKSMLAWQKSKDMPTPESAGLKGDKLVGHFYVEFEKLLQSQTQPLLKAAIQQDFSSFQQADKKLIEASVFKYLQAEDNKKEDLLDTLKTHVRNATPIMQEARAMLQEWEAGDEDTIALWKKMNQWVYDGFAVTYNSLGVNFDKIYYESNTYLLGKDIVNEGLEKGILFKKEDGSVWIDLTDEGLDQKLLLRSDGTSVYITQDLGTADLRYKDFAMDRTIYVVGNEQEYHFKVLQLVLKKLGRPYADGIHHFSYGMVDLPSGKMKSREGTVVDADDLISDMIQTAQESSEELGKTDDFSSEEAQNLYKTLGLGALKFFLLRVDPKKRIMFNPAESIDLHGYTGPFVQYSYARIQSIYRKFLKENHDLIIQDIQDIQTIEKELILKIAQYPTVIELAALDLNPAKLIDYTYELAKLYNKFYSEVSIFNESQEVTHKRVALSVLCGRIIKDGFNTLGIEVPERM